MKSYIFSAMVLLALGAGVWALMRGHAPAASSGGAAAAAASAAPPSFLSLTPASATAAAGTPDTTTGPKRAPAGYREYRNVRYRFDMFVPGNLAVSTYDQDNGAAIYTFENDKTLEGFQVYVTPYADSTVTPDRFRRDEPSGVMQGAMDVTVSGAKGVSFFGSDPALGPTAEIWFLHGGYLFEVTAPKSEAAWLSGIMETWEFI